MLGFLCSHHIEHEEGQRRPVSKSRHIFNIYAANDAYALRSEAQRQLKQEHIRHQR